MKVSKLVSCLLFYFYVFTASVSAQHVDYLQPTLQGIADKYAAAIGFSAIDLSTGKTYSVNGNMHLPMQSVYKFHLALAILAEVDKGKLTLNQSILIKKTDLLPDTWSPLRVKYPDGNVKIPLSAVLMYTVGQSDNNGCDILFRLLGGPLKVQSYMRSLGIQDVAIVATEEEMHKNQSVQFNNWTTSDAAIKLLTLFYKRKLLSAHSHNFLWKTMTDSPSGPLKIKGQLPKGTPVAHKTGYSGVDNNGITNASNDIGIVTMPNGQHFAIAAFISNTKEKEGKIDSIIAELSQAVWDQLIK
jgi:beta-lactamase class A